jgi:hypothetical protein
MKRLRVKRNTQKNSGSVLALMVMLTLLLTLTSLALAGLAQQARLRSVKKTAQIAARFAADAGIERTVYRMNADLQAGTWTLNEVPTYTNEQLAACNADYTVTFDGSLQSGYRITSVGKSGRASHTVRVLVELRSPFSEDFAVLTRNFLNMKNKSTISGYDSGDLSQTNVPVAVGTLSKKDGSINIKNAAVIEGDVYVGPDSDPDKVISMKNRSSITGEIFVMPTPKNLPVVTAPDFIGSKGKISGKNITLTTADSGKYTQINISNKGKLLIDGDLVLYVTGDVSLDNSAELNVKNGSTLKLYFDSDIDLKNGAEIANDSKIPSSVQLFGTGVNQTINLKNSSDLYGVIYAPDADMVVHNKTDIYGSFIVDNFELKNSGDVYYDRALKNVSVHDEAVYFAVTHWEEL